MSHKTDKCGRMAYYTPWGLAALVRVEILAHTGSQGCAVLTMPRLAAIANQLEALSRIHAEMDGREWDGETMASIADYLQGIGLEVRDVDSCDCDSRSWHGEEHDSACPLAGLTRA